MQTKMCLWGLVLGKGGWLVQAVAGSECPALHRAPQPYPTDGCCFQPPSALPPRCAPALVGLWETARRNTTPAKINLHCKNCLYCQLKIKTTSVQRKKKKKREKRKEKKRWETTPVLHKHDAGCKQLNVSQPSTAQKETGCKQNGESWDGAF